MSLGKRFLGFIQRLPCWVGDDFGRNLIHLTDSWPEGLEIKVATGESELEEAFRLVHDRHVEEEWIRPHASGLAVLPQNLMPQASTIIARLDGKTVGSMTLIPDNPIGLPIETHVDLRPFRKDGSKLAEITSVAIANEYLSDLSAVFLPLFRFTFHYATHFFGVQKALIGAHPSLLHLYRSLFAFERISWATSAGLDPLILDLEQAPARWEKIYGLKPDDKNLMRYLLSSAEQSIRQIPDRNYSLTSRRIITPKIMENLFIVKAGILRDLKPREAFALFASYPHDAFEKLIRKHRWTGHPPVRHEVRADTEMKASISETSSDVSVRNLSRHGLRIWSDRKLPHRQILTLHIWINSIEQAEVRAQVRWSDSSGYHGLRILTYSTEWAKMIQAIEEEFETLAA